MNIDDLMRNKIRVRAVYASGSGVHVEGRIVGYREHPSVVIETDRGEHVSWGAHLIEPVEPLDDVRDAVRAALREVEPVGALGYRGGRWQDAVADDVLRRLRENR